MVSECGCSEGKRCRVSRGGTVAGTAGEEV